MESQWNQGTLQQFIDDKVEENVNLEYKAAAALGGSDDKKKEISKDVSAMANSDGGVLIYGIREYDDRSKDHLPEALDPIVRASYSREWLEQVINSNIHPRILGLKIYPVSLEARPDHVIYVIEIPKSTTAHQAKDQKYYRRYNFGVLPMYDHEIRDVMNRASVPSPLIEFELKKHYELAIIPYYRHTLRVKVKNGGIVTINRHKLIFRFPNIGIEFADLNTPLYRFISITNDDGYALYYEGRYRSNDPIFPEDEIYIGFQEQYPYCLSYDIEENNYDRWLDHMRMSKFVLSWSFYADNILPKSDVISFSELYD